MAKTIWNKAEQQELLARLSSLTADSMRNWGSMDVAQMLKHIDIAYKNALGKLEVKPHPLSAFVAFKPVKYTVLYVLPFQKNLMTATEYKVDGKYNFQSVYQEFLKTFDNVISQTETENFSHHPLFGQLNKDEWGTLLYKHLDHHLRQFGA